MGSHAFARANLGLPCRWDYIHYHYTWPSLLFSKVKWLLLSLVVLSKSTSCLIAPDLPARALWNSCHRVLSCVRAGLAGFRDSAYLEVVPESTCCLQLLIRTSGLTFLNPSLFLSLSRDSTCWLNNNLVFLCLYQKKSSQSFELTVCFL
jgi:hypothetical protein